MNMKPSPVTLCHLTSPGGPRRPVTESQTEGPSIHCRPSNAVNSDRHGSTLNSADTDKKTRNLTQHSISAFFQVKEDVNISKKRKDMENESGEIFSKKQVHSKESCTTASVQQGEYSQIIRGENTESDRVTSADKESTNCILSAKTLTKLHQFDITNENMTKSLAQTTYCTDGVEEARRKKMKCDMTNSEASSFISNSKEPNLSKFSRASFKSSNARKSKVKPSNSDNKMTVIKYTPLEKQFHEIKEANPRVLLFVECGYKFRFFGEDAEIAAKELNIFCHQDHNFMTASIPTHRLNVHVSRLVSKGYKVGVVKQTETAALKAVGENRSAPFTRQLTNVYTKATLIDGSIETSDGENINVGGHMLCLHEEPCSSLDNLQTLAILSVDLATGEVIYDVFSDNRSRYELETRLTHIQPMEIIISQNASESSEQLLNNFIRLSDNNVRTERVCPQEFQNKDASNFIKHIYEKLCASMECIRAILRLPHEILCCLCALLSYLEEYNLTKVFKLNSSFTQFSMYDKHMQLCGRTLRNLEVFENSSDRRCAGSLFWLLNQTQTAFGGRMLKHWMSHPLLNLSEINGRLEAIQDILDNPTLGKLEEVLKSLPDLDRGLTQIFHGKCSAQEFISVCDALSKVARALTFDKTMINSTLLNTIFEDLPHQLSGIDKWVKSINGKAAKDGNSTDLFANEKDFPKICDQKENILKVLSQLQDHKKELRLLLKTPALEFTNILGTEFLVEVKNTILKLVPQDWVKINGTKAVTRFHTPFIIEAYKRLSQHREKLQLASNEAWQEFLRSFENDYSQYKKAVKHLGTLDCLNSLAKVAKQQGYCRPCMIEEPGTLKITQGCHPVVNVLLMQQSQQYVGNDTHLQAKGKRCMLVTGPNMGGKSSYIKQVALISLMAQIGSFVPAEEACLSIMDAIYTRMGASDNLCKGQSTFMVELQEASEVISKATKRSLVILDELGRGTSTHDGVAIAHATLKYFVEEVKCLTLFVTHYPTLVQEVEQCYPDVVANYHMSFYVQEETEDEEKEEGTDNLIFLYQLVSGVAERSYGLNVARLANIPGDILKRASVKSQELELKTVQKMEGEILFKKLIAGKYQKEHVKGTLQKLFSCKTNS